MEPALALLVLSSTCTSASCGHGGTPAHNIPDMSAVEPPAPVVGHEGHCARAICVLTPADHFGRRLRQLRDSASLTQRELADAAGMAQPAVARLESCPSIPTLVTLTRLGAALDCDFSILIAGVQ